jgi:hypothetical protein
MIRPQHKYAARSRKYPLSGFHYTEEFVDIIHQFIRMLLPGASKDQSEGVAL